MRRPSETMATATETVAELFPDLMSIRDPALREKVAAVWEEAIRTGCGGKGWTEDELRSIPFTLLAGEIDLTFIEHVNSCVRQCIVIEKVLEQTYSDRVPINHDHLVAGALLADVGKPLEYDKDEQGRVIKGRFGEMLRHPFSGVALCHKHDLPPEAMHIVATHSHEGDRVQRSIESIIFHHADFVDFDIAKYLGAQAAQRE